MIVVVPTEERGDIMIVVIPNMVLTSITKLSIWILFHFSGLGGHQIFPQCVKSRS